MRKAQKLTKLLLVVLVLLLAPEITAGKFAYAKPVEVRWTGKEDSQADFEHVLAQVAARTGFELHSTEFSKVEDRELATTRFQMWVQTLGGLPLKGRSVRIWTNLKTGLAVQVEGRVEGRAGARKALSLFQSRLQPSLKSLRPEAALSLLTQRLSSEKTVALVQARIRRHSDDKQMRQVEWTDVFSENGPVREVTAKGRRGTHQVEISLVTQKVTSVRYQEFPQSEFSIPAQVYPVYEQVETTGAITQRVPAELKYIKSSIPQTGVDPYGPLRTRQYLEEKFDPMRGETEEGRAQGFWAMSYVKRQAAELRAQLPLLDNSLKNGAVVLEGRYVTVSLHQDAVKKFTGFQFVPQLSSQFRPDWRQNEADGSWQMIPGGAILGRPIASLEDAFNRPARRLPNHDPVSYINDGFDELQVYYAVNALFDSLRSMGFTDPDLSTRPFHAFLYDPDISMRDNAYYTDDTINFTTYSPEAINFARDNSTIWHELGHGVMDRMMGDSITLADTGGLSEGMADFIAALIVRDVTDGKPFEGWQDFRIINKTGFFLTNEVHDDGEAYGGAMHDLLDAVYTEQGRAGLKKVTDLTLESMRLCRNHPRLTADEWFNHMLFADELGAEGVRAPGELRPFILHALAGRNFDLGGRAVAKFVLKNRDEEVLNEGPGSRGTPIRVELAPDQSASFPLSVSLSNSEVYGFKFPVTVKVEYRKGALQGAIHWLDEEKGPKAVVLSSPEELARVDVGVSGTCDYSNRDDGSCVDYAYVQIWNDGETDEPRAKKRFYLRVKKPGTASSED